MAPEEQKGTHFLKMKSPLDQLYYEAYEKGWLIANQDQNLKRLNLGVDFEPPKMDLRIRMIFDEDLNKLNVPRVKELVYKVNKDAPFEAVAKALADRNGHPALWQSYSFSILRAKPQLDEDTPYSRLEDITDLRKRFGSYMRQEPSSSTFEQELVFFYKINSPFETSF